MLNIRLLCVGKLKERFHKELVAEYCKRLSRYCKISVVEVEDEKIAEGASDKEMQAVLEAEGKRILKQIRENEYLILLDLHGEQLDSISFSHLLKETTQRHSSLTFAIGGSLGVAPAVQNRADFRLCLSKMTFTHQMSRGILLEQIYRAFKIQRGETYHK